MGLYTAMFYGGLILAIIFLIAAGIIFFVMDIPKAFGVVTGKTQRKAIEEIRAGGKPQTTSKRGRGSSIIARDVKVSESEKKSQTEEVKAAKKKEEPKRSSDASSDIAKKAAEDARAAVEKSKARIKAELEDESTEVLTYQDMKNADSSEDTTSVLEMEQATDVLTAGDEVYSESDDAETDVLTSDGKREETETPKDEVDESYDDEATDVLRSTSASRYSEEDDVTDVLRNPTDEELYDDDLDEADKTDVLTADTSGLSADDIYGTYNPEMTAVLRSDMAPGEDSVKKRVSGLDRPEITVIYCETVVHTDESL